MWDDICDVGKHKQLTFFGERIRPLVFKVVFYTKPDKLNSTDLKKNALFH
jgi:hypothetical protein